MNTTFGRRKLPFGLTVVIFALFLTSPTSWSEATNTEPKRGKAVRIAISRKTTFVKGPIGSDGFVDFFALINKRAAAGVTPKNNAAVLLVKAVGLNHIPQQRRKKVCAHLQIPVPPARGKYFVTTQEFATRTAKSATDDYSAALEEQLDRSLKAPWSRLRFRKLSAWHDANAKPLRLLHEALGRKRFYLPLVESGAQDYATFKAAVYARIRLMRPLVIGQALLSRAMLAAHERRLRDAQRELLACHRLARIISDGPLLYDVLVGCTLENIAHGVNIRVLQAGMPAKDLKKYQKELAGLRGLGRPADKINQGERFLALLSVMEVARRGGKGLKTVPEFLPLRDLSKKGVLDRTLDRCDWNIVLSVVNRDFTEVHAAMKESSFADRADAVRSFRDRVGKRAKVLKGVSAAGKRGKDDISRSLGEALAYLVMPQYWQIAEAHDRAMVRLNLTKVAVALEWYRVVHGRYPKKLREVVPAGLSAIPKDVFSERDFVYRGTAKEFVLYSVGRNGRDDGGSSKSGGDDYVVRMKAE